MKHIYTLLLFFITLGAYSQIELEHSYAEGHIKRALLEISGEKYFQSINIDSNVQCLIFNADHSLWKTIDLPVPEEAIINYITVSSISETWINMDHAVEVSYTYHGILDGFNINESRIVNENGSVLLSVEDAVFNIFPVEGLQDKLISVKSGLNISEVYTLPGIVLENEYPGSIRRINLDNSGEKYYFINEEEATVELFNSDHSFWKTISLTTEPGASIMGFNSHISENKINTDDLLEVVYRTMDTSDGILNFTTYVINENGELLLTVEDGALFKYSRVEGLDNKLFVRQGVQSPNIKVYSLPVLSLEHAYEAIDLKRINLESSGEKFV